MAIIHAHVQYGQTCIRFVFHFERFLSARLAQYGERRDR